MRVLAVIPARYGSSRFPGKPLIDLKGKSMIQRVYEGVLQSSQFSKVIVATDDSRIYEEVERFGGSAIMTSTAHETGTDRCGEVLTAYPDYDIVVNVQGDEPLVDFRQLDTLIAAFEDASVQIATLGIKIVNTDEINNTNRIKIAVNHKNEGLYFSRSPLPSYSNSKLSPLEAYPYLRHIGLYAFRADTLRLLVQLPVTRLEQVESLEQLRWLYHGYKIQIVETTIETPNIDSPEDIAAVLEQIAGN